MVLDLVVRDELRAGALMRFGRLRIGLVLAVVPNPVTKPDFGAALDKQARIGLPERLVRLFFGEMAQLTPLVSERVLTRRARRLVSAGSAR